MVGKQMSVVATDQVGLVFDAVIEGVGHASTRLDFGPVEEIGLRPRIDCATRTSLYRRLMKLRSLPSAPATFEFWKYSSELTKKATSWSSVPPPLSS